MKLSITARQLIHTALTTSQPPSRSIQLYFSDAKIDLNCSQRHLQMRVLYAPEALKMSVDWLFFPLEEMDIFCNFKDWTTLRGCMVDVHCCDHASSARLHVSSQALLDYDGVRGYLEHHIFPLMQTIGLYLEYHSLKDDLLILLYSHGKNSPVRHHLSFIREALVRGLSVFFLSKRFALSLKPLRNHHFETIFTDHNCRRQTSPARPAT